MATNIQDVALKCGLSTATVSRALSGKGSISSNAKAKVLAAVEELNYRPNALARSLVRQKTNIIGIVISDISAFFSATILSVIEQFAADAGYNLMICNVLENQQKEKSYLNAFMEMQAQGIIIMHDYIDGELASLLKNSTIPCVCASVRLPGLLLPTVIVDEEQAGFDSAQYLISLGHTKIAYFGSDEEKQPPAYSRFAGYARALKQANIPLCRDYIFPEGHTLKTGYQYMQQLLRLKNLPTAIFASSDDMAMGAMSCAQDHSLQVPHHISIMGFDNSEMAPFIRPSLTTMSQSFDQLGKRTFELLSHYIENPGSPIREIIVPHQLKIRGSCGPPA